MTKVKICGINDPASFDSAVEAGADWVGFVFFPPSPRYLTPDAADIISRRFEGGPRRVGLFVKPAIEGIRSVLSVIHLDILQIYDSPEAVAQIRQACGLPVWQAVGVSSAADLPMAPRSADGFVIEAKPPVGATRPGGNAATFDWTILAGWHAPVPWLLAGGLTPDNVGEAVFTSGAKAVDVSSGVEVEPGVKSPDLIRSFIRAAKQPS